MTKQTLLVPLDGTEFSRHIVPHIHKHFPPDRYRVVVLHASEATSALGDTSIPPAVVDHDMIFYSYGYGQGLTLSHLPHQPERHAIYQRENLADARQQIEQQLRAERMLFEEQGYDVHATVHFGEPAEEIVSFIKHEAVDLVAMATHGRQGLSRLLAGSVSQEVLGRVNIPVLLLRVEDTSDED